MECNLNSLTKLEVLEEENNDMITEVISESNNIVQNETQKTEFGKHCRLETFIRLLLKHTC